MLKGDLKVNTIRDVTIEAAVMHIVSWAERKLVQSYTLALRKDIRIFHHDPLVQYQLDLASLQLNKTGCILFKKSLDLLEKHEASMVVKDEGVLERFQAATEQLYNTSEMGCNCSRWVQDVLVCRHILFLRKFRGLSLFDINLFSNYYQKKSLSNNEESSLGLTSEDVADDPEVPVERHILDSVEKFKVAKDLTDELRELLCHFGTEQFETYMYELEILKRRVRRGQSMISQSNGSCKTVDNIDPNIVNNVKNKTDIPIDPETIEGDKEHSTENYHRLSFLQRIQSRGRPKRTRTGRLRVPKSKKPRFDLTSDSLLPMVTIDENQNPVSSKEELSSSKIVGWHQICSAPPTPGQIGDNVVTIQDYSSLTTGSYITDSIINWRLRDIEQNFICPGSKLVLVLSTDFYERLKCWNKVVTHETAKELGILQWLNYSHNSPKIVLLPVCWQDHFYLLVAVMDVNMPVIHILESIGGSYATTPPMTVTFGQVLRCVLGSSLQNDFKLNFLDVPHQPPGSNDCGLYLMKYGELILRDPEEFIIFTHSRSFREWFPSSAVCNMRRELAERIRFLAEDQRKENREMVNNLLEVPLPSPQTVFSEVHLLRVLVDLLSK